MEDQQTMSNPVTINNVEFCDHLRIFSGDGPAREWEAGQQRGDTYPCIRGVKAVNHSNLVHCFRQEVLGLEKRRQLALSSKSLKRLRNGELNPLRDLNKK